MPSMAGLLVNDIYQRYAEGDDEKAKELFMNELGLYYIVVFSVAIFSSLCDWIKTSITIRKGVRLSKYMRYDLYHNFISKLD